jgi:carbon monoxide dehydrogenase subunit G
MRVERSTTIAKPPAEVLAYMADVRNDPSWHTDVLEVNSSTDAVQVGTVFNVRVKPSMGVSEGTMTVRKLEPGKVVEFEGHMGKMAPTVTNLVEPEGAGTRVTRRVELDPPGPMKLMTPMIKMMIGKSNQGFLANLKKVLET